MKRERMEDEKEHKVSNDEKENTKQKSKNKEEECK